MRLVGFQEVGKAEQPSHSLYLAYAQQINHISLLIDYEGYSVLPMAIRQDTIVAIRRNESEKVLKIANVNGGKYSVCTYPADPLQEIDLKNHKWGHYFICGKKGIFFTGSGLSSSAAFVCSSTITIMAAFDVNFPKVCLSGWNSCVRNSLWFIS
ncbi:galactokinase-like [Cajanus cajan]|uniref:galactokinase-like n=1 Tax=Cajanus cajan TaxID=3821 RepID=UPI0010FAFDC2|nr:galactokinase-like [Cajanus cajan]